MDIGTAKPSLEERARVPHHLFDIVDPDADYSAGRYAADARTAAAADPRARPRWSSWPGGSGLYIRAFLDGLVVGRRRRPRLARAPRARARTRRWRPATPRSCTGGSRNGIPRRPTASIPTTCGARSARWRSASSRAAPRPACARTTASKTAPYPRLHLALDPGREAAGRAHRPALRAHDRGRPAAGGAPPARRAATGRSCARCRPSATAT